MEDRFKTIDKFFRLANYLTICQMYLKDNFMLKRKMVPEDLKQVNSGHWGVTPTLNFVYANLNYFIKKYNIKTLFVIGTGHAGCPLLSNQFLDGTLSKYYPEITWDYKGMCKLINMFGDEKGFRSEVNPQMPKTLYEGGELGYALAFSFGASLDNKDLFIPCLIGDGEAETGTTSSSWQLIRFLNNKNTGKVLPILNLNGKKMGSDSIFSTYSDEELIKHFSSIGYEPLIVSNSHEDLQNAFEKIKADYSKKHMIILKIAKGWTAPKKGDFEIEGKLHSHKNPLHVLSSKEEMADYLEYWLKSYDIGDLIDEQNGICEDIKSLSCIDLYYKTKDFVRLDLPDVNDYFLFKGTSKNVSILSNYLADVVDTNHNYRVFSPDELVSNTFGSVYEVTSNNLSLKGDAGKISEILNENICQALMQGYIMSGRHGVFVGYEAFMPIITSQISQAMKFMYETRKIPWNTDTSSFNYVLTSTCFENNYSHQNPEFINTLLNKNYDFTNVYMPPDANSCLLYFDKMLKSKKQFNILVSSKGNNIQHLSLEESKVLANDGAILLGDKTSRPDVVLACTGDYVFTETLETYKLLKETLPNIKVNVVYVAEPKKLKVGAVNAFSDDEYYNYFDKNAYTVYMFHGYESVIRNLLYEREGKYTIIGYKDKSDVAGDSKKKLELNGINKEVVANDICLKLLERGKVVLNLDFIKLFREEHRAYGKQLSFLE